MATTNFKNRERRHYKRDSNNIYFTGTIIEALPNTRFNVEVSENNKIMKYTCSLIGQMKTGKMKLILGDKVTVEINPYDFSARIVELIRERNPNPAFRPSQR